MPMYKGGCIDAILELYEYATISDEEKVKLAALLFFNAKPMLIPILEEAMLSQLLLSEDLIQVEDGVMCQLHQGTKHKFFDGEARAFEYAMAYVVGGAWLQVSVFRDRARLIGGAMHRLERLIPGNRPTTAKMHQNQRDILIATRIANDAMAWFRAFELKYRPKKHGSVYLFDSDITTNWHEMVEAAVRDVHEFI
ncbi:uncharacterized protein ACA1_019980 [Acanthamoeba castellanii str. Neff]|uniref:Uncharacterized protein n=1 Tax=Acanthamoeba castellanii (strain ATCC 30010 / Neff) TaxID=1257118 RepID=L8GXD7_ACACF|nr:uncharacterized protein ACA1_019980 [Acanthamoeba castellanii str. Neff]ELR16746.1 hypothetical protein ACA1_019980 [Acanthamoeba castellanii str. Neff]